MSKPKPHITVESNIPIPESSGRGPNWRYPWRQMLVGDSFEYRARSEYHLLRSAFFVARQASKREGKKFRAAVHYGESNGRSIRIWRVQ